MAGVTMRVDGRDKCWRGPKTLLGGGAEFAFSQESRQ
jgi:hypothetical protein